MSISAAQVKQLRDQTGAGMMDAKKALTETSGDMEAAIDWLRTKGIAKAAKKAGRTAAEGMVWATAQDGKGVMVEVNSETDFAAKNEQFQTFATTLGQLVLETGETDMDKLQAMTYPGTSETVADMQTKMIATIGENINFRRASYMEADTVGAYIHMGGKIGVLVGLSGTTGNEDLAKQVAMHVAATNPQFLTIDDMDPDVVAREKAVYTEQAKASGKPENVVEKMVEGRMRKFGEEVCLAEQAFVMDTDRKVSQVVADAAAGAALVGFTRFALGEGIEKEEADFAAEVAKAVNG